MGASERILFLFAVAGALWLSDDYHNTDRALQNTTFDVKDLLMETMRENTDWPAYREPLLRLSAAMEVEELWEGVLALLQQAFQHRRITLFLGHLGMKEARRVFTFPPIPEAATWFEQRARQNPFSPWIEANIGKPYYHFEEIVGPPEVFRTTPFYAQFASVEGWDKGLSGLFWREKSLRGMFSIYRGSDQEAFGTADFGRLLDLMPFMEAAVVRVQRFYRERNFRHALESFNKTDPVAMLLFDWELRLVYANGEAYRKIAVWNFGPERARGYNARECYQMPDDLRLQMESMRQQMEHAEWHRATRQRLGTVSLRHSGLPGYSAEITPVLFDKGLARPGFFIIVRGQESRSAEAAGSGTADSLRYRSLTPAEREIVREVCAGLSNQEIAEKLHKSIRTVKTQMHAVFQKMGVDSRTRLIASVRQHLG